MNTFSLAFSIIGIVVTVFLFGNHLHTAATVIMVAIPTAAAMVIMGAIPTAATMILGHHHPTPTVTTPITRKTYRCSVTASTTPSASKGD